MSPLEVDDVPFSRAHPALVHGGTAVNQRDLLPRQFAAVIDVRSQHNLICACTAADPDWIVGDLGRAAARLRQRQ
jgi:hypothetical protein